MVRTHGDRPFGDDEYIREGGVLIPVNTGHEVRHEDDTIAPDDVVEDVIADEGVPGTQDDLPYDYGVEIAQPADQMILSRDRRRSGFGGVGHTGSDKDEGETPLGAPDERELWRKQKPLIAESGDEAARYAGLEDSDIARVEQAVGEDAAETFSESPEGESATGSV
jgi:hypothetical protein